MTAYDILVSLSPYVVPLLIAIGGGLGWLLGRKTEKAVAKATVEKLKAESEMIAADEWKRLYDETNKRLLTLEGKLSGLQNRIEASTIEIERLQNMLSIANNGITYLLNGIAVLTGQMSSLDVKPDFVPEVSVLVGKEDEG